MKYDVVGYDYKQERLTAVCGYCGRTEVIGASLKTICGSGLVWWCVCGRTHMGLKESDVSPLTIPIVQRYMRMAKNVADNNKACYSRQLGAVIVRVGDDGFSNCIASGFNGPPKKTPPCDSSAYLKEMVLPQLSQSEKDLLVPGSSREKQKDNLLLKLTACGACPRKLVGAPSGTRLELCCCSHCEASAISNAACDIRGTWMFCWCPTPCWDCAKLIVDVGIKRVFTIVDDSYGEAYQLERSKFLFNQAGVKYFAAPPEFYLTD